MPLDDLVSVIETLQQRIKEHGHALNETQTRTALIDPLLTALGWDVSDPGIVTPEYRTDVGWADYALRGPGNKPSAVVEAKRLGSFVENHLDQAVTYCIQQGIAYAAVTDGNHWQMYRTFEPVPLLDKRVLDVQIGNTPAFECALKFLLLWRPNLASGRPVEAEQPIFQPDPEDEPKDPLVPPSLVENWQSLVSIQHYKDVKFPTSLRFPGEGEQTMKNWRDVLKAVAEWQINLGNLTPERCPIAGSSSTKTRYVIHSLPEHKDGKRFSKPQDLKNGCFLEAHGGNWARVRSKGHLSELGGDPNSVQIKLS